MAVLLLLLNSKEVFYVAAIILVCTAQQSMHALRPDFGPRSQLALLPHE